MNNGWISVHRKIKDKGWFLNSYYVHLWVYILIKANHEEKEFMFNGSLHKTKRGEFITGRNAIVKETGIPATTIERILDLFVKERQIGQQKNNKFRLITVINYDKYQDADNKRTSSGHLADTNNNYNNYNKECMLSKRKPKTKKTMDDLLASGDIELGGASKTGTPGPLDIKLEKKHQGSDFGRMCISLGYLFDDKYFNRFNEHYKNGSFSVSGIAKNISKYKEYSKDDWKKILESYFESKKARELVVTLETCFSENTIMQYKQSNKKTNEPVYFKKASEVE
jgi:hypothetical protein